MYSCPYCEYDLKVMPRRKRKCPSCNKPIYIKSTPDKRNKRIMTEVQAMKAEEEWGLYNTRQKSLSELFLFDMTERDLEKEKNITGASDPQAMISLLVRIERETDDLHKRKMALLLLAAYAEEGGKPFYEYLVFANLCQLLRYKQGQVKKVEILTAGPGNSCTECEKNAHKVLKIDEALQLMPLPHPSCTHTIKGKRPGFCRCGYIPVVEGFTGGEKS